TSAPPSATSKKCGDTIHVSKFAPRTRRKKRNVYCVPMRAAAAVLLVCAAARAEEIRIEVARGLRVARVEAAGRTHLLSARESGLLIDGKPAASAGFTAPMRLDGRALPGRLELFAERGTLVAVNAVDLEQYVAAVVASEVPHRWPREALRAQAVAARTFAVAQKVAQGPASRAHLGASDIPKVKRVIRAADVGEAKKMLEQATAFSSHDEIERYVLEYMRKHFPQLIDESVVQGSERPV